MPPKQKVTRDDIIEAAFRIARERGAECISARSVADMLGCSTQPVLYHFSTVEEVRRAVYQMADQFHSAYLMTFPEGAEEPMLEIGLNYIRFSIEEPHLFRFLFQSGYAVEKNLLEMMDSDELKPVLGVLRETAGVDLDRAGEIFLIIALFAHGYASIIANNNLEYDEAVISAHLERAYRGAVLAAEEETE